MAWQIFINFRDGSCQGLHHLTNNILLNEIKTRAVPL